MSEILPIKIREVITRFSSAEQEQIKSAYFLAKERHAGQLRRDGKAYISHPVRVALELAKDNYDKTTIIAGLLHDVVEDTPTTIEEITDKFGSEIAAIVNGVTKVSNIKLKNKAKIFSDHKHFLEQVDNYRKILFAAATDPRVIVVKLYDRLDNIRTIKWLRPHKIMFYARETIEIFAPVADRLGMGLMKTRLEDLSFPYAYPEQYKIFKESIKDLYKDPALKVSQILPEIRSALEKAGIKFISLLGRAKGEYSLYKKVERKGSIKTIYDIMALRVIVSTVEECYRSLGVIHSLYAPIPGEIDDYIAKPKSNGYQSIHTTIKTSAGHIFEIQIRTDKMHEHAEYGANTAHWNYKEINHGSIAKGKGADWTKELDKLNKIKDNKEFLSELTEQLFAEQIFVFTPKGDIFNLPLGSTAVDFAYRIHSDLGDKCTGARINGRISPLQTKLNTSDVVEILAGKVRNPSSDWLRFIKTSQARQHIRSFIRENQEEHLLSLGEKKIADAMIKYELKPVGKNESEKLISESRLPYNTLKAALIAVGENALKTTGLMRIIYPRTNFSDIRSRKVQAEISKAGIANLKYIRHEFAKCCKPKESDKVIGYLGREHIIKVHKVTCHRLKNVDKDRLIEI
jgi:RelA/SpoT family (p)ppGpp synthetase